MADIGNGERQRFALKIGKENSIGGNAPMKFKITLPSGGYISGIISANASLTICPEEGDIQGVEIVIDEDSKKKLSVIE